MAPRNVWSSMSTLGPPSGIGTYPIGDGPLIPSPISEVSGTDIIPSRIRNCMAPRNGLVVYEPLGPPSGIGTYPIGNERLCGGGSLGNLSQRGRLRFPHGFGRRLGPVP